jgi:hypothetical protein
MQYLEKCRKIVLQKVQLKGDFSFLEIFSTGAVARSSLVFKFMVLL